MSGRTVYRWVICSLLLVIALSWETSEAQEVGSSGARSRTPPLPPHAHYAITCRIDTATRQLTGSAVVQFTNSSPYPLSRLALDWSLSKRQTVKVMISGGLVSLITDSAARTTPAPVLFDLPREIAPGGRAEIKMDFAQSLPALGQEEKITLTQWFPKLWWGVGTHDDYDVRVDVPSDYALGTSGRWSGKNQSYHGDNIATFGLFLGKGMHIMEANAGDVLVRCLFSTSGEKCARLVLNTAVDAINFYRDRFGFYPYKSLDIVPGYSQPWGGYNAATSLSVIHGEEQMTKRPEIHWRWITAHEIGHMYWGEYVLDKDDPAWLWIGMGIYGDREYVRARGLSLEKHRQLMAPYLEGVRNHVNTTVAITPEQWEDLEFDFNNIVTHGKGFSIISALANYLGKETFERIYLRCLKQFGKGRMGAAEFQTVCETESGENLGWFFDQWVRSNRYLAYQITGQKSSTHDKEYLSTVAVERTGTMRFPVPVVAYFEDGTFQRKVTDRLLDLNMLKYRSNAPLKYAIIDPDSELALVVPPPQMTGEELINAVDRLSWTDAGKDALPLYSRAQEMKPTDVRMWFKLGMTLYDGEYYEQALQAFQKAAELSRDSSTYIFAAHVWRGQVLDILGRREEAIKEYRLALHKDVGQEIRHGQYDMMINRKWAEERIDRPFVRR